MGQSMLLLSSSPTFTVRYDQFMFDVWEINEMTYACIAEYYKNQSGINRDGVMCYKPGDDCDSDEPGDEWEWVGEGKAGMKKK